MRAGKLTSTELNEIILKSTAPVRDEVLLSAALAEDCAAVKSDGLILLTTDPITAAGKNQGKLAVLVCSNDVVSSGGEPFCCLLTIIAPPTAQLSDVNEIMADARRAAASVNVDIVGGHTEFSDAVTRPVVSCTMLGKAKRVIKTSGARVGDRIVMTKSAGIEATAILSHEFEARLISGGLTEDEIAEGKSYIDNISVYTEGRLAAGFEVSSMHDITEGGVYGAVAELCEAAGVGAEINADAVPVTELTAKICSILGLDAMRLISSGSILITVSDEKPLIAGLRNAGIEAVVIGAVTAEKRIVAIGGGGEESLSVSPDELLKIKR